MSGNPLPCDSLLSVSATASEASTSGLEGSLFTTHPCPHLVIQAHPGQTTLGRLDPSWGVHATRCAGHGGKPFPALVGSLEDIAIPVGHDPIGSSRSRLESGRWRWRRLATNRSTEQATTWSRFDRPRV